MGRVRDLDRKTLTGLFVALSLGTVLLSLPTAASVSPTGSNFDHIVIIAMENQNYGSVIGSSSAPFINSLARLGTVISNYHSYGQGIGSGFSCSAACYQAFTAGQTIGSDGWCPRASSPCKSVANIASQLSTAGLTSAMFCEDGCPRGADHFPWIGYTNTWNSCVTGTFTCSGHTGSAGNSLYGSTSSNSGVFGSVTPNAGNAAFINYLNGTSPANYIWFTPSDSHNMHDNNVTTGDNYLKSLLVGTGTFSSPSPGTVFSTNLLKQPRTFLYLWWDEYDPSPNVEYGSMIKVAYTSTGGYDQYNSLHTIEENWGLPYITNVVCGDTSMTDIFSTIGPQPLSACFTYLPTAPLARTVVSFTALATGGTLPYTYAWNFGDGVTATGLTSTHTYSSPGNYTVTLTVTDATSRTAKSTQTVGVVPIPVLTATFTQSPPQPTSGQPVTFTGIASGGISPYGYSWSFGDGYTSTAQAPIHTYASSGTFTVKLNVTDSLAALVSTSGSITISPPGALAASFTFSPTLPFSGQTVTFTAMASGGTGPYIYSWNLGGASKTGNPASQSFSNGTYTISLTVTDGTLKSITVSQNLVVLATGGVLTVPVLIGWGGIRLDESAIGGGVSQPTNPPASAVFPGESATNMEIVLIEMKSMGYNTVRVDFDPYCTGSQYMSSYSAANLQRAIQIAQYYGFWIIVDYHGYSEVFNSSTASCWLNFWSSITNQFKSSYNQIIWEPLNEPCYSSTSCAGYGTNNNMCSGASACVTVLSKEYQQWINQTRGQGDAHWIVVQNICSYGCSLSNWATGFPTVMDPLGTLSTGGKIFISLHSYMGYSSTNWNNATADSMAQQYYQAVISGVAATGWPALNTEGGADPLCTSCAPDQILAGSAGYTVVTFHFIQALTTLYDSHTPQRVNWIWWPAGSWTNTPGAGIYGALQCNSIPIGWGCLLNFQPAGPPPPDYTITSSSPSGVNVGQSASSTITIAAKNSFTGTINLSDGPPNGLTCVTISPSSIVTSGTASVSCNSNVAGTYLLPITGNSDGLIHTAAATFNFQDFRISASSPATVSPGLSSTSTITLTAVNGFAGTITLIDTIPSGLTCNPFSSISVTGSGSSTLSCSSATQSVYTVTITASSGALLHNSSASFTFGTPPDFTLTATSPSASNVGASITSTITVDLIHGLTSSVSLTDTIPSGLSCGSISHTSLGSNGTATVSCTSNIPATYMLTITGTSGSITHTTTITFTFLTVQGSMSLLVPASQTVNELTTVTFTVTGADSAIPTPSLTIAASQLPIGATFTSTSSNSPSGTFAWTPDESQTGVFTIGFTLTDGVTSVPRSVTITVVETNTPPTITAPGAQTISVGKSLTFTVTAANPSVPRDPVKLSATGLVSNMVFDPASGAFSFTPDQSQGGKTFVVNFTATYADNPSASSTQQVTITTESSSGSSGGLCLSCILPGGVTLWLLLIGALMGVVSSIAILTLKAHSELAFARRRSRDRNQAEPTTTVANHKRKVAPHAY